MFYSSGITVKSEGAVYLPKSQQPFGGWLLDGPQKLAQFRHGRFATFHLEPGAHTFTVEGPAGPGKQPLALNVQSGGHYCVRLYGTMINALVYARWENKIEEVPCQDAQRDAADLKPIEIKRVDPAVRAEFDPAATFPADRNSQAQH